MIRIPATSNVCSVVRAASSNSGPSTSTRDCGMKFYPTRKRNHPLTETPSCARMITMRSDCLDIKHPNSSIIYDYTILYSTLIYSTWTKLFTLDTSTVFYVPVCEESFFIPFHSFFHVQIDLLYIFDGTRAVVEALLASDPISGADRSAGRATVSCDTGRSTVENVTQSRASPVSPDTTPTNRGRKNFAWLFRVTNVIGALGVVVPGTGGNNSIVDAKMAVEEQTIAYDKTNITQSVRQLNPLWSSYHTLLFSSNFWILCAIESINQSINVWTLSKFGLRYEMNGISVLKIQKMEKISVFCQMGIVFLSLVVSQSIMHSSWRRINENM